jgi:rubrerythrin
MPKDAYAEFMAQAYALELEATERYTQFAEQLDTHNNRGVAEMFRKLAAIEALHAKRILEEMGWPNPPPLPAATAWDEGEGPEAAPLDAIHYLMQPFHALQLALECELRAQKHFEGIVKSNAPVKVLEAAAEMAEEEREHVRLVKEWMARVPQPSSDWDHDPDPPRMSE